MDFCRRYSTSLKSYVLRNTGFTDGLQNKKLQLRGECISELDSNQLSWKFVKTVNGKYNGTYYVVWNAFVGGSKNMVGAYVNAKGREFQVNLKCVNTESLRER